MKKGLSKPGQMYTLSFDLWSYTYGSDKLIRSPKGSIVILLEDVSTTSFDDFDADIGLSPEECVTMPFRVSLLYEGRITFVRWIEKHSIEDWFDDNA